MTNEIKCIQFTAYDRHMRPEIDNDEYLEHELVETGLASQVCSFGWIEINSTNGAIIKWVKKTEIMKK